MKGFGLAVSALLAITHAAALAQPSKPIDAMLADAASRVERDIGRRVAFVPAKRECPANPHASVCHFRVGNSVMMAGQHHATGVRLFSVIRMGTSDSDWRDIISVLAAFMEPEQAREVREAALGELFPAVRNGNLSAKLLGRSVIAAGFDREGRENWSALQDETLPAARSKTP